MDREAREQRGGERGRVRALVAGRVGRGVEGLININLGIDFEFHFRNSNIRWEAQGGGFSFLSHWIVSSKEVK